VQIIHLCDYTVFRPISCPRAKTSSVRASALQVCKDYSEFNRSRSKSIYISLYLSISPSLYLSMYRFIDIFIYLYLYTHMDKYIGSTQFTCVCLSLDCTVIAGDVNSSSMYVCTQYLYEYIEFILTTCPRAKTSSVRAFVPQVFI